MFFYAKRFQHMFFHAKFGYVEKKTTNYSLSKVLLKIKTLYYSETKLRQKLIISIFCSKE